MITEKYENMIRIAMLLTDSRFYSVLQNTDELTVTIYYLVKYQGGVTGPNFFQSKANSRALLVYRS